ncbi:hypothetical protein GALLR39Z86_50050 [Glycomyces algeriensis]|uniref:Uncharacterized protein n=1 Tax=Glycomyces algeriensis TaxID=256037 RepID=A0A9W6GBS5_9ACTN|nr:hypothetical protein GALLR39Z86_50050 [Glycomyces algeriensis]
MCLVLAMAGVLGVIAMVGLVAVVFVVPRIVAMGVVTAHWRLLPYGCFSAREYTPRGYTTSRFNRSTRGGIPEGLRSDR